MAAVKYPELQSRDWLRGEYIEGEQSTRAIAAHLGCSRQAVKYALRRAGIKTRQRGTPAELQDARWMIERYLDRGMTVREIAGEIGCSSSTVAAALNRHSIEPRERGKRRSVQDGERFGMLTVLRCDGTQGGFRMYVCRCDCGHERRLTSSAIRNMASCGCRWRKHGHTVGIGSTPTYMTWAGMQQRCYNPNSGSFKYYGARGITVCDRWRGPGGFENFLADMGEKPTGLSIDRIENDGNYEPGNCRWATAIEQRANRRPSGKQ